MSFDKAWYENRKKMHICVDCGDPVDYPDKYVRCKACRSYHKKALRDWREAMNEKAERLAMKEAAEKAIQAEKNERLVRRCAHCEWASFTGASFVCPFPEGACMKQQEAIL